MLCGPYCHPGRHCVNINFIKADTPIVDLTKEQGRTTQEENWIVVGDIRLTLQDEKDLGSRSHHWLNDRHITAAQHLLKQQHPAVSGLQPTTLQLTRTFDVHRNREFVQCLNVSSNHWVTVSTIGCPPGSINVYDSMHLGPSTSLKKVIADMMHSDKKAISIRTVHIQQEIGGSDCGLFAIANATALCHGKYPGTLAFNQKPMRDHLRKCLAAGTLTEFPCRQVEARVPQIVRFERVRVYCVCRQPNYAKTPMVECTKCREWFHLPCVSAPREALNHTEVPWYCNSCT